MNDRNNNKERVRQDPLFTLTYLTMAIVTLFIQDVKYMVTK